MSKEVWKDVVGYEDRYQVSNMGRLRSKDIVLHKSDGKTELRRGKVLSLNKNTNGYYTHLMSNGVNFVRKNIPIHRLVAMAFIPSPLNKPNIDHINTIRTDNRVENLRWCTQSENNRNPITKKVHKGRQHIVTVNPAYICHLYLHQTGEKRPQSHILQEVLQNIDDFIEGKYKRIIRFIMPDGSPSITITPLVRHNLQERRKAKRRKR